MEIKHAEPVAKGYLTIKKVFVDGRPDEFVIQDDPNVIMMDARRAHLTYLYETDAVPDILAGFRVGVGGAVGSDTQGNNNVKVIPPDPTRSDLYSPIKIDNTDITVTPSDSNDNTEVYLRIVFSLSQDDANGLPINECGLFKKSGRIFNHKTFVSVQKNESFSLVFDWKIRYI